MKDLTGVEAIQTRLNREWERGRMLAHLWGGDAFFPYRIPLASPTSQDLVDHYQVVRKWIQEVSSWPRTGVSITWREFKHPVLGPNRIPVTITFATPQAAIGWIGKLDDAERATTIFHRIQHELPILSPWALAHPLTVLAWGDVWPRLLTVVRWVIDHPRSGLYLRQVDAPGIDTKFIERHRGIVADLLDDVLDPAAIDPHATGSSGFEARYGFRQKAEMVRFRFLDPTQSIEGMTDLTVPSQDFGQLSRLPIRQVVMMENEIEFLAFPRVAATIAIFGAGYGLKRFQCADWLSGLPLYYWGDLDTHGFAILDELRLYLPHAQSLLMDEATLLAHRVFWDREERPSTHQLTRLTSAESALYADLQQHRFGDGIRLEQERIPMHWLIRRLAQMRITTGQPSAAISRQGSDGDGGGAG